VGGHLEACTLKKLAKDAHLRARCVTLVSLSSCVIFASASAFQNSNTSCLIKNSVETEESTIITLLFRLCNHPVMILVLTNRLY
jgi:hypothetical protein